jgi:hypothetical protein
MVIGKSFINIFASEIAAEDSASVSRFEDCEGAMIAS